MVNRIRGQPKKREENYNKLCSRIPHRMKAVQSEKTAHGVFEEGLSRVR